jgi:hypothetical protein
VAPYENALTVDGYEISGDGEDFDKIHARLSALRPGGKLIVTGANGFCGCGYCVSPGGAKFL